MLSRRLANFEGGGGMYALIAMRAAMRLICAVFVPKTAFWLILLLDEIHDGRVVGQLNGLERFAAALGTLGQADGDGRFARGAHDGCPGGIHSAFVAVGTGVTSHEGSFLRCIFEV